VTSRGRILVSMGLSVTPRNVERTLASLWTRHPAEIAGLLIEDLELLNLSRLPVSREIRYDEPAARVPDLADMERQMQAQARRIREAFEARARRMNVASSFRVARGPLAQSLLEACAGFDVLVLASARDWIGQRLSLRAHVPELLARGPRTLIVVQEAPARTGGVAAVYLDTPGGRAALQMAADIARDERLPLAVLLPAPAADRRATLRATAEELVGAGVSASYYGLATVDAADIAAATARAAARVLVLPRDDAEEARQLAIDVLERIDCSVIVTGDGDLAAASG
jgi:hypothetical protein